MHRGTESPQLHFRHLATHHDVAVLPQIAQSPIPQMRTLWQYPVTTPFVLNGLLMDGRAPAPIPLKPTQRASMSASAPIAISAGIPRQLQPFRAGQMSRFEHAGHIRGRSASPMYRVKSAQMLPSAEVFERQAVGSLPAISSTAKVSTSTAGARPLPAARSFSSPPAQRDSVAVKKALEVYRAFVPTLAKGVPQSAGSISAVAGAGPTLLKRSLSSKVPVPVQIAVHVDSGTREDSDATRASGAFDSCAGSSTPTIPVPTSPVTPDGRSCSSSVRAFKRQLSAVEAAHVKDLLSRPSGLHELREGTWKEFGWALAANGHAAGKPGCLDYPHALTVLRQLVYLNGLPALDAEATTQVLDARVTRDALACSSMVAAIGPDDLHEALLDLLRAAVNFNAGTGLELTSV